MAGLRATDWCDNFLLVIDEELSRLDEPVAHLERRLDGDPRPLLNDAVGEWSIYVSGILSGVLTMRVEGPEWTWDGKVVRRVCGLRPAIARVQAAPSASLGWSFIHQLPDGMRLVELHELDLFDLLDSADSMITRWKERTEKLRKVLLDAVQAAAAV